MSLIPKLRCTRLPKDEYTNLRCQVLARDGWRCQQCGSRTNLEIHHQILRCRLGDDREENLTTLCTSCHWRRHNGGD